MVNGGRRRHAERGADLSCGGTQVAVVGDVQVKGVPRWEGRWGAGATERYYNGERMPMGGQ